MRRKPAKVIKTPPSPLTSTPTPPQPPEVQIYKAPVWCGNCGFATDIQVMRGLPLPSFLRGATCGACGVVGFVESNVRRPNR